MAITKKTKFWFIIILACLIVTLLQIPPFLNIWQEFAFIKNMPQSRENETPAISHTETDPNNYDTEAADIFNYLVSTPDLYMGDPDINDLSILVSRYPQNEFFIFELAQKLLKFDDINPAAPMLLADKLLKIDPNNAHYNYLKASILMGTENNLDFEKALTELDTANNAPDFYYAYNKYKQRIKAMVKTSELQWKLTEPSETIPYHSIHYALSKETQNALDNNDFEYADRLIEITLNMANKLYQKEKPETTLSSAYSPMVNMNNKKLKIPNLSTQKAQQAHFQIANGLMISDCLKEKSNKLWAKEKKLVYAILGFATSLTLLLRITGLWLFVTIVTLIKKQSRNANPDPISYILFFLSLAYFFALIIFLNSDLENNPLLKNSSLMDLEEPTAVINYIVFATPIVAWLAVWFMSNFPKYDKKNLYKYRLHKNITSFTIWAFVIIYSFVTDNNFDQTFKDVLFLIFAWTIYFVPFWIALMYGWFLIRILPWKWLYKNRLLQLILILTSIAGLRMILINVKYISWPMIPLIIMVIAIIITHQPKGKSSKLTDAIFKFFRNDDNLNITRAKIVNLLFPYIIFCWIILIASNFFLVRSVSNVTKIATNYKFDLPISVQDAYQQILQKFEPQNIKKDMARNEYYFSDIYQYIAAITPQDLTKVLNNLKNAKEPITDDQLLRLITRCGKDVQSILINALENPEDQTALKVRAKIGDTSVKDKLLDNYSQKFKLIDIRGHESPDWSNSLDIAESLAYISQPDEAAVRYLDLIELIDTNNLNNDDYFSPIDNLYRSIDSLPTPQNTIVLKAYLDKTDYYELRQEQNLYDFSSIIESYADTEITEKVFEITLQNPAIFKSFDSELPHITGLSEEMMSELSRPQNVTLDIWRSLTTHFDTNSVDLLKKGLNTDNTDLRLYLTYNLTRLNYNWTDDQLENLNTDPDWRIRLNALFIPQNKSLQIALNDQNPAVRLVANMINENK